MPSFTIDCAYCSPTMTLLRAEIPDSADEKQWRAAWKKTTTGGANGGPQYANIQCNGCGSQYQVIDDGVGLESGGSIMRKNISRPGVSQLDITAGVRNGGTVVTLTGSALEQGVLNVKFGELDALNITNRTETSVQVTTPPATYTLNVAEYLFKATLGGVSGTLLVDEAFTVGTTGASGSIRHIDGSTYLLHIPTIPTPAPELIGEWLTGGTSSATGRIDALDPTALLPGEQVVGQTTGAIAVVAKAAPVVVTTPTDGFGANELVLGQASGNGVVLGPSPAYSGAVDVVVENELGQRSSGSTLAGGYTYF